MADAIRLVVKSNNLPKLLKALDKMEDSLADQVADKGVAMVQAAAPKRTGRLAASYHKETQGTGQRTITNSEDAYYALFVELGTRYMAAQPHVVPTAVALEAEIPAMWQAVIADTLG
jgi:HK97 gp10 family phage protein